MPTQTKADTVAWLAALLRESTAVFAVDYRGLTARQMGALRDRVRDHHGAVDVAKNTLVKLALCDVDGDPGRVFPRGVLFGPTALVSGRGDPAELAAVLVGFAREHKALEIKGGRVERTMLRDPRAVHEVADLVSRTAQLTRTARVLRAVQTDAARAFAALLDDRKEA